MRLLLLALLALPLAAGEFAVLTTGFRIHAERHETVDGRVSLYTGGGVIELPAASVAAFEPEDYVREPAPPVPATPPAKTPRQLLDEAAERYGVPREILRSVASAESSYRQDAVSRKGAIGVMQLMPATARQLQADPHDLAQNVDAGARHLRDLLLEYNGGITRTLAAYNAGAGAVRKYGGVPPYRETQNYVETVLKRYHQLSAKNHAGN